VALVTEQGYTVIEAAESVGVRPNQIYNWKNDWPTKHQVRVYQVKIEKNR